MEPLPPSTLPFFSPPFFSGLLSFFSTWGVTTLVTVRFRKGSRGGEDKATSAARELHYSKLKELRKQEASEKRFPDSLILEGHLRSTNQCILGESWPHSGPLTPSQLCPMKPTPSRSGRQNYLGQAWRLSSTRRKVQSEDSIVSGIIGREEQRHDGLVFREQPHLPLLLP